MRSPNFIPATDESLEYGGSWTLSSLPDTRLTQGQAADTVQIRGVFRQLYGVFHLHEWSGIIAVEAHTPSGPAAVEHIDLFAPFPHDQRLLLYSAEVAGETRVRLVASGRRNPGSFGAEVVLRGFDVTGQDGPPSSDPLAERSAQDFADMQSAHFDRWRAQQDDDHYAAIERERQLRYLERYRRASIFFGKCLLDIGCGHIFTEIFELLDALGIEYHGLDIDPRVVEHVNQLLPQHQVPGLVELGEIGTVHLEPEAYDTIFSSHTLEHSSNLPRSLNEMFRALRPGGRLILAVPLGWDDSEEHVHCYGSDEWLSRVRRAGFDVVSFEIARLYDPSRYDLTIIAGKNGSNA